MSASAGDATTQLVAQAKESVAKLARQLADRGWLPATSGNLSVQVEGTTHFCITPSGVDKGSLDPADVLLVDHQGQPLEESHHRPSAETIVHQRVYDSVACGCVLHVHTIFNNLVSDVCFPDGMIRLADHELLKALGHWQEKAAIEVPIVENFADLAQLASAVQDVVRDGVPGVLVRRHGIYAFGNDVSAATRHLEAFEFLFEYEIRRAALG